MQFYIVPLDSLQSNLCLSFVFNPNLIIQMISQIKKDSLFNVLKNY